MTRKRKHTSDASNSTAPASTRDSGTEILKTVPIIQDFTLNPSCSHGPTILFEQDQKRFFACSAYRSRKLCRFYMPEEKWLAKCEKIKTSSTLSPPIKTGQKRSRPCGNFPVDEEPVVPRKKNKTITHPLSFPNQRDKGEAQYHFNEETIEFFLTQFRRMKVDGVLCVGTPSLHEAISTSEAQSEFTSILLDMDERFCSVYEKGFTRYNMCNHHFFEDSTKYKDFLSSCRNLAVIIDPPFGAKVELIWHGCVTGVKRDYQQCAVSSASTNDANNIEIFWIFPYFMEGHISKSSGKALQMSDFHVEYRNHKKFSSRVSGTKSSPVRVFTTVPLSDLRLPGTKYRFCDVCGKWVDLQNLHCDVCETCPTKDGGQSYVHCFQCEKCVKPTWSHCKKCKVCHLSDSCKKLNVSLGLGTGNTSTLKKKKPTPVCGDRIKSGIKSKSNHKSKSLNTHSVRRLGKSK